MPMERQSYEEAREKMKPGDVIAFGGKHHYSEIIKWATCSVVSHVGVILQTNLRNDASGDFFNQIIESTSLEGFNGVHISRFSDRLNYDGELWWLPLREDLPKPTAFFNFLLGQKGKRYDLPQAIGSAVDALDRLPLELRGPGYNREDFSKFFCSELVAAGLEAAGAFGDININASEVTPVDLCRWRIYEPIYYQLKGEHKEISRYNTLNPSDWNV